MDRISERRYLDRRAQRRVVVALQRGAMAALVLATAVAIAQAGGLPEKLFTGKGTQRTEAPGSAGNTAQATVRLTVDGMVCSG
jgi:ferric-dicitrate binding protein FerR (iron transport regulator)